MFFNMDAKDLAFIKQPISKNKAGENEPGFIPTLQWMFFILIFKVSSST